MCLFKLCGSNNPIHPSLRALVVTLIGALLSVFHPCLRTISSPRDLESATREVVQREDMHSATQLIQ